MTKDEIYEEQEWIIKGLYKMAEDSIGIYPLTNYEIKMAIKYEDNNNTELYETLKVSRSCKQIKMQKKKLNTKNI